MYANPTRLDGRRQQILSPETMAEIFADLSADDEIAFARDVLGLEIAEPDPDADDEPFDREAAMSAIRSGYWVASWEDRIVVPRFGGDCDFAGPFPRLASYAAATDPAPIRTEPGGGR